MHGLGIINIVRVFAGSEKVRQQLFAGNGQQQNDVTGHSSYRRWQVGL